MNKKIDAFLTALRREDVSVMNILQQEQLEEEEGETFAIGVCLAQGNHNRDTYVTPNTEVHSSVFVDEVLGDTIIEAHLRSLGKR